MADARFYIKPGEGAQVEARVTLRRETPAAVCGTVLDGDAPAPGTLALLFEADGQTLIDRQFTDEDGQFFFGPLAGDTLYLVKLHKAGVHMRELPAEE